MAAKCTKMQPIIGEVADLKGLFSAAGRYRSFAHHPRFLQVVVALISAGRPTRRNRFWKRESSRKPSMLGSI